MLLHALLACAASFQDAPPVTPLPVQTPPTENVAPKPLVPGEIPADASAEARALWAKLVAATRAGEEREDPATKARTTVEPQQPTGFDVTLEITAHPDAQSTNNVPATRYRFQPPGFVRTSVLSSGRERLRGPQGDFLIDKTVVTRLEGREFAEDRKEIAGAIAVAQNFLNLADPRKLRLAKLALLAAPPNELPQSLRNTAAKLQWLALESPDFELVLEEKRAPDALFRVELGLDPQTSLPELALVCRARGGARRFDEHALLVRMTNYKVLDGFRVPFALLSYEPDRSSAAPVFFERSSADIYLKSGGTLRPKFGPADFSPPAQK